MALSGSFDFSLTRDQLVNSAIRLLQVVEPNKSALNDYVTEGAQQLNMMLRAWQHEGIGLWFYREVALFPAYQTASYNLYSGGAYWTLSHVYTQVATAASSGATSLVVDSITGITASDVIGIELDDGTRQWTTVNGTPSGTTITLAAALTDDVAVDNTVFAYTSKGQKPLGIMEARRRDKNNIDTPLMVIPLSEYRALNNKTDDGTPTSLCYDPQFSYGTVFLWPRPKDVSQRIMLTVKYPMNDLDAAANDIEFPPEWYEALQYNLALRLAPMFLDEIAPSRLSLIRDFAIESKLQAQMADCDFTSIFFAPDYERG